MYISFMFSFHFIVCVLMLIYGESLLFYPLRYFKLSVLNYHDAPYSGMTCNVQA